MPAKKPEPRVIEWDTICRLARALPDVQESTTYGAPALKVRGKMMVCVPSHKSAEPGSLVVRVDFERRAEMLEAGPDVYYLKEHYVGYPCVLVRLERVNEEAMRDLLGMAWRFVTGEAGRKRTVKRRGATRRD